jgi:hypothetical protein
VAVAVEAPTDAGNRIIGRPGIKSHARRIDLRLRFRIRIWSRFGFDNQFLAQQRCLKTGDTIRITRGIATSVDHGLLRYCQLGD